MATSPDQMEHTFQDFHIFPSLPLDLRLLIWETTFPRRLISFTLSKRDTSRLEDTPFQTTLQDLTTTSADPRGLFAIKSHVIGPGGKMISNGLPLPRLVCTEKLPRILALSVCKESRDFALRVGYRSWKLRISIGSQMREIMWNPLHDTIFLDEKHGRVMKGQPLFILTEKFRNTYPIQARELRSLAVFTSLWNQKEMDCEAMVEKWVEFSSLKIIVAVLDCAYETARVDSIPLSEGYNQYKKICERNRNGGKAKGEEGVLLPGDLEVDLAMGKMAREEWEHWETPKIILSDRYRLMKGMPGSLELRLRCYPCDDLTSYIKKEREDEFLRSWKGRSA